MTSIVGYSGFVGSNLLENGFFEKQYNSKNIQEAFGLRPDLLIYAGVRAEKYLANKDPENDLKHIFEAALNIERIQPRKVVLISTIDVYKNPVDVSEDSSMDEENLQPYGKNRLTLENWVQVHSQDYHIIRLPGLFGRNIKKNFIYDMINVIPSMLIENKYNELNDEGALSDYYTLQDNGFYRCRVLSDEEKENLKEYFRKKKFTALNFTDSRALFQFYNLSSLWNDIHKVIDSGVRLINFATEPVSVNDIYKNIYGKDFVNEILSSPPVYNFKTKHDSLFSGDNGYIKGKEDILNEIKDFVRGQIS